MLFHDQTNTLTMIANKDTLTIQGERQTPYVHFDISSGKFEIIGNSIPENPHMFFQPIFKWVDENVQKTAGYIQFHCNFRHINTVSHKYLLELLRHTLKRSPHPEKISVKWICDEDDEDLLEVAMGMKEALGIPFQFGS